MASDLSKRAGARQTQLQGSSFDQALGELLIARRLLPPGSSGRSGSARRATTDCMSCSPSSGW
jgi:hypothetical protein